MLATVPSKRLRFLGSVLTSLRCYHAGKASSVDTAIRRGIRKSNGLAFRGKNKTPEDDPRKKYMARHDIPPWTPKPKEARRPPTSSHRTDEGWAKRSDGNSSKRGKTNPVRIRRGKKEIRSGRDLEQKAKKEGVGASSYGYGITPRRPKSSEGAGGFSNDQSRYVQDANQSPSRRGRTDEGLDGRRTSYQQTSTQSFDRSSKFSSKFSSFKSKSDNRLPTLSSGYRSREARQPSYESRSRTSNLDDQSFKTPPNEKVQPRSPDGSIRFTNEDPAITGRSRDSAGNRISHNKDNSRFTPYTRAIEDRAPLSVPYTTPASEFLYGTSVVEAALSSQSYPRRKLYKLYIYTGENRENVDRDADLEKLARKNRIEVVKVAGDWLRLLDKMSTGRPHNGYILEASPLPRLPITCLGDFTGEDGHYGFNVTVDYQSKEEVAVNGTESFIRIPKDHSGRKPLVLLLDSIVDPGNLGGIIRSASFLGVTAVAISTRNSAPFSPVVLKASAGASENLTLFSVNKPQGFIVDSKAAGWKVFAAVAPAKRRDPGMPELISTDHLGDPLSESPCILMLGGEGDGLRWNLRSKSDADLFIRGSRHSFNVDSLNVSVATGILCNAFMSRNKRRSKKTESLVKDDLMEEQAIEETAHETEAGVEDKPTLKLF